MKTSIKKGFSFGLTSAIITTLGIIVGLNSTTHSQTVILGGILIIAVADALSDSFSVHISEESELKHKAKTIWEATISTFLSKFIFALSFLIPILLLELQTAIIVSILWGLSLITLFSYYLAKQQKIKPYKVIVEHLIITILVISVTHILGGWIATFA